MDGASPCSSASTNGRLVSIPYLPSVAAHALSTATMIAKLAGSTWLFDCDNRPWPVVLCSDDTPTPEFMKTRKDARMIPAILLGWVK